MEKGANNNTFLLYIINQFLNKKDTESVRNTYNQLINANAKDAKDAKDTKDTNGSTSDEKKPHTLREYEKRKSIIEKCFNTFMRPAVRHEVSEKNLSAMQVYSQYAEEILGDNKRKYNMSDKFDETLIAYVNGDSEGEIRRLVAYQEKIGEVHPIPNSKITIQPIGKIGYINMFKDEKYVMKYRVTRKLDENNYDTFEVFSNIDISRLDDEEYSSAIVNELLSENNIQLSGTGGYIGTIVDENNKLGLQTEDGSHYRYQVSKHHALEFDGEDLSAVISLEKGLNKSHKKPEDNSEIKIITVNRPSDGEGR